LGTTGIRTGATVAVVGAGLTGSCVALALARDGIDVVLLEQDHRPMNRASLRNEGKIHLGLVYANDRSLATARLMLKGALSFGPVLEDLLGRTVREVGVSTPFAYLVAQDSLLTVDEIQGYYERLQSLYEELLTDRIDYLGTRPERLFRSMREHEWQSVFSPSVVGHAFDTAELSIDCDDLAGIVRRAVVSSERIDLRLGHRLEEVTKGSSGYILGGQNTSGPFTLTAEQVANCTWERRAAIDQQVGMEPAGDLLHRLKYRVVASLPDALRGGPSATMVLGRYGDVVVRANDTVYLSWYPASLLGWTNEVEPPRSWDAPCRGEVERAVQAQLSDSVILAITDWYPHVAEARPLIVDAGVIVARGLTDVDVSDSALHGRTQVGVTSIDGYHSVNSGKLTTSPLFAVQAANRVAEGLGRIRSAALTTIADQGMLQ